MKAVPTMAVKELNKRALTRYLYTNGPATKQVLERELGLSLPTITQNLRALEQEGLVGKGEQLESTGGRKAQTFVFESRCKAAIGVAMHKAYKRWHVATLVTQIEVDPDDPSFQNPTKPIGAFMTKEQADAEQLEHPDWTIVEDSGRGYRRVVASPEPKKIVEAESILNLLDNEFIVIACGGGGVPVVRDYSDKGAYKGVAAVIDKDMAGELLAEDCQADMLVLLTAVDHVAINWGKPDQVDLDDISVEEARRYADAGQFGKGSMEPKVRAAIKFCESRPGRTAIIGSLEKAAEAIAGLSGTHIHS